nr:site-specific DNA-methyltransferase [Periweissella cryptocerci]
MLLHGDAFETLAQVKDESVDAFITDPPYFLSNGGFSNSGGKVVSVDKGDWDKAENVDVEEFYSKLLDEARRVLKPNGALWIFGTMHNIYTLGYLLKKKDWAILNNVTWQKSNPAPNLSRRMFTHSTETILWAKKEKKAKQTFNYDLMREYNGGKQMKDVWTTSTIRNSERIFGKHPTQKPLALMERIIEASTGKGDVIIDPFVGSGTTALAGMIHGRQVIGVDLETEYLDIAKARIKNQELTLDLN